jgi:hypothetical protein
MGWKARSPRDKIGNHFRVSLRCSLKRESTQPRKDRPLVSGESFYDQAFGSGNLLYQYFDCVGHCTDRLIESAMIPTDDTQSMERQPRLACLLYHQCHSTPSMLRFRPAILYRLMQHRQQNKTQHKHTQWNQEMTVGSNRLYLFRKIQNNPNHLSILSGTTDQSPAFPFTTRNKTNEITASDPSRSKSFGALSSKFRYIGVHAPEAVFRDPAPRCQSGDSVHPRRIAYRACSSGPPTSHAETRTPVSTGSHSEA